MPTRSQQKPKSRLGRGLSSLLSVSELPVEVAVPSVPETQLTERGPKAESPPAPAAVGPVQIPTDQIAPAPISRGAR